MTFEWDKSKNKRNVKKHGISFERAIGVWLDEKRIVRYDPEHSFSEDRWIVIGMAETLLFVVFVEKNDDIVRLISARRADSDERKEYYKNYDLR